MSRFLGVDYGTRRIGLAVSDPLGMFATALEVIQVDVPDEAVPRIVEIVRDKDVETIVVGLPLNMDGSEGDAAAAARAFASQLREAGGVEVVMCDERLSTYTAESILLEADMSRGKRKKVIDKLAAQVFLQQYLDEHS